MKDCLEAKLFGIGLEAYTVGSHDFYAGYCSKNNVIYTLDTGHYEPTENVSDAVSSLLLFVPELMLHVSRPMHWDSDHVTLFDDNTRNLFAELVRANALDRAHIGLDYFDASINRIGAYIIGVRAAQKSRSGRIPLGQRVGERNGGNITVNITDLVDDDIRQMPAITEPIAIGEKVPHLRGTYFFCKGTDIMFAFDQVDVLSYERLLHKLRDKCAVF